MHLRRAQAAQAAQVGAKEQEVLANAARQLALEASKPQAKQAPQATAQRKRPIAPPAAGGRGGGGSQNQLNRGAADWAEAKRKSLGIASDAPPPQLSQPPPPLLPLNTRPWRLRGLPHRGSPRRGP